MGAASPDLVVLTYNVLCPVYKRLQHGRRESDVPAQWRARMRDVINDIRACTPAPDVICLQEFWFENDNVQLFREAFAATYTIFCAKRPGKKEDGLATLIKKSTRAFVRNGNAVMPHRIRELSLLPRGDRVALLVALRLAPPACEPPSADCRPRDLVIVNTHLTFPHAKLQKRTRLDQARSISKYVHSFCIDAIEHHDPTGGLDVLVLGDLNGGTDSRVCNHLLRTGYSSCLAEVWGTGVSPATHRNHLGQNVFVDHVFIRRFFSRRDAKAHSLNSHPNHTRTRSLRLLRSRSRPIARDVRQQVTVGGSAEKQQVQQSQQLHRMCSASSASSSSPPSTAKRKCPALFRRSRSTLSSVRAESVVNQMPQTAYANDEEGVNHNGVNSASCSLEDTELPRYRVLSRNTRASMSMSAIFEGASALGCSIEPVAARVLPEHLPTDSWPEQIKNSDHRPVCVEFRYSWSVLARVEDAPVVTHSTSIRS